MLSPLFSRPLQRIGGLGLLILLPLLWGCGTEPGPDLGAWTLTTDELTLTKDLQVSETEHYFFGDIQDLDVTSEGRIVALDAEAHHVKVLRPDGSLIDTLGRRGRGPGEFQRPTNVVVARGDSIYVFDNQVNRLTVFSPLPAPKQVRSMTITSAVGSVTEVRALDGQWVGRFTPGYTRTEGMRRPQSATWRRIHETGSPGDTLLISKRRRLTTSFDGPGIVIAYLPFTRVTRTVPGPDNRLYHGFTDSLHIQSTSLHGARETVAAIPGPPVPIPEAERDSAMGEIPETVRGQVAKALPNTKPAFTDLVAADDGRLWVKRPTETAEAEAAAWWILTPASQTIQEVRLPSEVGIEVVQNGMAYGTTTTEAGAPAVVRYRTQTGE